MNRIMETIYGAESPSYSIFVVQCQLGDFATQMSSMSSRITTLESTAGSSVPPSRCPYAIPGDCGLPPSMARTEVNIPPLPTPSAFTTSMTPLATTSSLSLHLHPLPKSPSPILHYHWYHIPWPVRPLHLHQLVSLISTDWSSQPLKARKNTFTS